MEGIAGGLIVIVVLCLYFIPAIIALSRGHKNGTAIFVLDLFLGWTLVGWVVALVWAFVEREYQAPG